MQDGGGEGGCIWKFCFEHGTEELLCDQERLVAKYFRHYLLGNTLKVRTDHNSLIWFMRFKNIEGQLARWIEELQNYDMELLYIAGRDHDNADGLSRLPDMGELCKDYESGVKIAELPCGGVVFE